ncbi:MAG: S49 family peptidase, partial [Candidatus Dormibacteria bacterium]
MSDLAGRLGALKEIADRRRIGVVPIRGVIGGRAKPTDIIRALGDARRNQRIHAVLLDIDSPGGGATSSEALYFAVRRLAQEKPVVAWFRGTGASGAYFLACGATRVLTFPSAIIGSIGVISVRPLAAELIRRLGARIQVTKTGPFKDLGAPWREPTDADRAKEQTLVDAIFARFAGAVQTA